MKKEKIKLGKLALVGLTARTNNKDEMNPKTSKIGALMGCYLGNQVADTFKHRVNPGIIYAAYTEFESNENGEYTYFIGEEVESMDEQDLTKFNPLIIAESSYQKFTTEHGEMPNIIINAWQKIWEMNKEDFGGKRKYLADFEIYDHRACDPKNAEVDIYIGIE